MKFFSRFELATGRVVSTGHCDDIDFELQQQDGMGLVEGTYTPDLYYWDGQQMLQIPTRPSVYHEWDWDSKAWVLSLPRARAQKWAAMKRARLAAMTQPLVTPHGTFDADKESRDNIIQTAQLMQTEAQTLSPADVPTVDFTLADNSAVTLSAGQMVGVALQLASQIQAAYTRGRQVRLAIAAATTAAELAAIQWDV